MHLSATSVGDNFSPLKATCFSSLLSSQSTCSTLKDISARLLSILLVVEMLQLLEVSVLLAVYLIRRCKTALCN
jgi:hypothetical protein